MLKSIKSLTKSYFIVTFTKHSIITNTLVVMRKNIQISLSLLFVFMLIINCCKAENNSRILEIHLQPEKAMVKIDDNIIATKDGIVSISLPFGEHSYSISAKNYHPIKNKIVIDDTQERFILKISLNPAFGFLEIQQNSTNENAKVFIDNTGVGTIPYKSDILSSGTHSVRIIKEKHQPYSNTVVISDGQTLTISPTLKSNFAIINVTTDNNAEIWIDGKKQCDGACNVELPQGEHIFETKLPGHRSQSISRMVSSGEEFSLTIPAPVPIYGSLKVTSKPFKSEVLIDGKMVGETPLFLQRVLTGTHQLIVKSQGMEDDEHQIIIKDGEIESLHCTLKRKEILLARVPVDYEGNYIIPDSITAIPDSAFFNCNKITSIVIPKSVTQIGNLSFSGCDALESVSISENLTTIGVGAFLKCSSLKYINIPNSVTHIGKAAFANCKSLVSITIPPRIKAIETYCFLECESLSSLIMNDSITAIEEYAFFSCTSLKSIKIPNSVKHIGKAAFCNCTELSTLQMSNKVDSLGTLAFLNCNKIESMMLPETLKYIGEGALMTVPHVNISFDNKKFCMLDDVLYSINRKVKDKIIMCNVTKEGKFAIPEGVVSIGMAAFYGCSLLTSVEFPNSLKKIGAGAFEGCVSLTDITLPETIDTIEKMTFFNCNSLKSIAIPKSVKTIEEKAFTNCKSLETVYIYNKDIVFLDNAFTFCHVLRTIFVPIGSQDRFTQMLDARKLIIQEMTK